MKITKELLDGALKAVGDDVELAQAIGIKPYWGHDTARRGSEKPKKALRAPEVVSPEEHAEYVAILDRSFFKGFNRDLAIGPND